MGGGTTLWCAGLAPRAKTQTSDQPVSSDGEIASYLFVALRADCPFDTPSRHRLLVGEGVLLGRGETRGVERGGAEAGLVLEFDDGWVSSRHARLACRGGRWQVEDLGSKNGTIVNGERVERAVLDDGDVIEVGRAFLVFRRSVAEAGPPDFDAEGARWPSPRLMTMSPTIAADFARVAGAAPAKVPVLVSGETGTGKELIARALHELSGRSGAFVAVNCAALPDALVEAELFGHKKGAFSGASDDRPGLLRAADRGTLLFDEVAELSARAQAALLRALQEREVRPVGAVAATPVDVRIVAATHRDLDEAVERGAFRADLLARFDGLRVTLPPLRERREDLGLVVRALLERHAPGRLDLRLSMASARALFLAPWAKNVRELERAFEAALPFVKQGVIELAAPRSPSTAPRAASERPPHPRVDERPPNPRVDERLRQRREQLRGLLAEHNGNVMAVAEAMGKDRALVYRWLKETGLEPEDFRTPSGVTPPSPPSPPKAPGQRGGRGRPPRAGA
jgi:transcriptional regulator with PAS, ATPase and Fis domain